MFAYSIIALAKHYIWETGTSNDALVTMIKVLNAIKCLLGPNRMREIWYKFSRKQRTTSQSAYQYKLLYWSMDERVTKAVVLFPCADAGKSGLLDGVLFLGLGFGGGFYRDAAESAAIPSFEFPFKEGQISRS